MNRFAYFLCGVSIVSILKKTMISNKQYFIGYNSVIVRKLILTVQSTFFSHYYSGFRAVNLLKHGNLNII